MSKHESDSINIIELVEDAVNGKASPLAMVLLFVVAALPFLTFGYGAYNAYSFWDLKNNGVQTEAEIVRVERVRSSSSSHANFYPVVRFSDAEGNIYEHQASRAAEGKYKAGDKDDVYFDPENPARVILSGTIAYSMRAFIILMVLGAVGAGFILKTVMHFRD